MSEAEKDERGYERVLYDLLVHLVHRMDRTIAMNKKTVEKDNQPRPIKPVDQARLDALTQQEAGAFSRTQEAVLTFLRLCSSAELMAESVIYWFVVQSASKIPRSLPWTEMQMDLLP